MAELRELLNECVHCGFCLPACPTYRSWNEEMDSPRGRIYLMDALDKGTIQLDETVIGHFDQCLGCMGCMTACPSGVQYDQLIEKTRATIEEQHRRSPADAAFRALIFSLFPYPRRLRIMRAVLYLYARSGLQRLVRASGVLRLLPLRLAQLEALGPNVTAGDLRMRLPAHTPAQGEQRARVALIAGCVQREFFPSVNAATIRVLAAEGCEVVVPAGQGCCGALSVHAGREAEAKRFAQALIARFEREPCDAIVVNAAGCGSSLKEYGRLFAADPAWRERAAAFAGKVRDVTEFLAALEPRAPRRPLPLRVAYHDACHLAHAQGIRAQPRALLAGIPELTVLEVPQGDQCCGSAGIYNLTQPASAAEIGERKVDNVLATGAELLVSANPGCTLQIQSLLRVRGQTLAALHPIEMLDLSLRGLTPASARTA